MIAELTPGEEVGETGEKISECDFLRLEWLLGYCLSVKAVISL